MPVGLVVASKEGWRRSTWNSTREGTSDGKASGYEYEDRGEMHLAGKV